VAPNTEVITSASTLGSTASDNAPFRSIASISDARPGALSDGTANTPRNTTAGSSSTASAEIATITIRIAPGTRRRTSPKIVASPITDISTGSDVMWPSDTGNPGPGFFVTS